MTDFINTPKAFLGRGWGFPVTFSKTAKQVAMFEAEEDVKSSLEIILQTEIGERIMQPEFGGSLNSYVFGSIDASFRTFLTEQVRSAIIRNEPRAELIRVDYAEEILNGRLDLTIYYQILGTNTRYNIVFPFYLSEGTDIQES